MTVHPRTVISKQRFRHERRRLAILISSIANHILEDLQIVGGAKQRRVTKVNLALSCRRDFVVMTFNRHATLRQRQRNLGAQIAKRVSWWNRDITFLGPNTIAKVGTLKLVGVTAAVPVSFIRINR